MFAKAGSSLRVSSWICCHFDTVHRVHTPDSSCTFSRHLSVPCPHCASRIRALAPPQSSRKQRQQNPRHRYLSNRLSPSKSHGTPNLTSPQPHLSLRDLIATVAAVIDSTTSNITSGA